MWTLKGTDKLEKQVSDLRRQYDDTKSKLAMRQKQVDSMQDKLKDLEKDMSKLRDDDTPLTRNIRYKYLKTR
jgi:peptidoglycan hydrolase CwlO-like protein